MSPQSRGFKASGGASSLVDTLGSGEESSKRRRVSSTKQTAESSTAAEESQSAFPCLVTLNPGVRIATVAAGGRHTLALSGNRSASWRLPYLSESVTFKALPLRLMVNLYLSESVIEWMYPNLSEGYR